MKFLKNFNKCQFNPNRDGVYKTNKITGSGISVTTPGRLLDDEWYGGGGTVQGAQDDGEPPRLELLLQAGLRIRIRIRIRIQEGKNDPQK